MKALRLCIVFTFMMAGTAFAAGGVVKGPNEIAPDRYVYYPGTEMLDEHSEKYNLQDQDWRKTKPWYEPSK